MAATRVQMRDGGRGLGREGLEEKHKYFCHKSPDCDPCRYDAELFEIEASLVLSCLSIFAP